MRLETREPSIRTSSTSPRFQPLLLHIVLYVPRLRPTLHHAETLPALPPQLQEPHRVFQDPQNKIV